MQEIYLICKIYSTEFYRTAPFHFFFARFSFHIHDTAQFFLFDR